LPELWRNFLAVGLRRAVSVLQAALADHLAL